MKKVKKYGKYLAIFLCSQILIFVAFLILRDDVYWDIDGMARAIYSFGTVIVILLSYLIAQIHYLIDLFRERT